jgi:L-malate glycosyltransferase
MAQKKILILCPYPKDTTAGQRLKYEQYIADWEAQGIQVDVSSFMSDSFWEIVYQPNKGLAKALKTFQGYLSRITDLFKVPSYDVVYIFMYVTPFGFAGYERIVRLLAKKVIYDLEDNLLLGPVKNGFKDLIRGVEKTKYLIRTSDSVITSSPKLNDQCLKINKFKNCTYISSSIDTDRYVARNVDTSDRKMTIGWTGTFSTLPYLRLLEDVLRKVYQIIPFKLVVICDADYELEGVEVESIRWKKETEIEDLQKIDIGVYPLPFNDWVSGKSGLKAIQYMAMSIPSVSTKISTVETFINHNENGMLVVSDQEWIDALVDLLSNPEKRTKLGIAGKATLDARFSKKVIAKQYREIILSVLG